MGQNLFLLTDEDRKRIKSASVAAVRQTLSTQTQYLVYYVKEKRLLYLDEDGNNLLQSVISDDIKSKPEGCHTDIKTSTFNILINAKRKREESLKEIKNPEVAKCLLLVRKKQ